jgi:phosphocarrier protein
MQSSAVTIPNPRGLHARPAAAFVKHAAVFESRILVRAQGREVDGKSIMGMLMLAAGPGAHLTIEASGPDEARAVDTLSQLVRDGFGEMDDDRPTTAGAR